MPKEIIPDQERSIIPDDSNSKILYVKQDAPGVDYKSFLVSSAQLFNMGDIISKIEQGAEYIVQVPVEYQQGLADGTLKMLHGKESGKTWATIVEVVPGKREKFIANCPIKEEMRLKGNPVGDLTDTVHNLYMQKKMDEIQAQIQDIYEVVVRIERGQMDDRIGKLQSGRNDLERALRNPDKDARTRELELARSKISEAQGQIGLNMKSRIERFPYVPKAKWLLLVKSIISIKTDYQSKLNQEFLDIQEYYDFYLKATNLLAYSYSIVGDTERASQVYQQAESFLNGIFYDRIRTVDVIYPDDDMSDAFHHQPVMIVEAERTQCLEEAKTYEFIEISVDGKELLGVINNVEQ